MDSNFKKMDGNIFLILYFKYYNISFIKSIVFIN
jgi:hypothetical protein